MTRITDMLGDLEAESSGHHLQWGGGILCWPHYRLRSLLVSRIEASSAKAVFDAINLMSAILRIFRP